MRSPLGGVPPTPSGLHTAPLPSHPLRGGAELTAELWAREAWGPQAMRLRAEATGPSRVANFGVGPPSAQDEPWLCAETPGLTKG